MKRALAAYFGLIVGCGASPSAPVRIASRPSGTPLDFVYVALDGAELSSATTRGRATAIAFLTTYDLASQLVARRLDAALRRQRPRANGAGIVIEAPKYAPLADAFRSALGLSFPLAMADQATLDGDGPFGRIDRVPTLIVLDADGRETWRRSGSMRGREIEQALASASPREFAPPP